MGACLEESKIHHICTGAMRGQGSTVLGHAHLLWAAESLLGSLALGPPSPSRRLAPGRAGSRDRVGALDRGRLRAAAVCHAHLHLCGGRAEAGQRARLRTLYKTLALFTEHVITSETIWEHLRAVARHGGHPHLLLGEDVRDRSAA